VEKESNPRQQLKIKIFEAYRNCIEASSPDILLKHKEQLWVLIDRWCKKYLFIKEWEEEAVEEMVEYIPDIIDSLVKENRTIKTYEEHGEFITYLNGCLKKLKAKTFYELLPESVIKARVGKYFKINKLIDTKERDGKLTENDRIEIITNYMSINKYKEIRDNILYPHNLEDNKQQDDEGKNIDPLNFQNVKSVFDNPESTNKFDVSPEKMREAVTYVLENKRQKRTRDCNRALFTVWCIKKETPDYYLDILAPVLDSDLLKTYRESGIKPTLYETYLKYHPERREGSENSVESNASSDLGKFLDDLRIYLKGNKF